MSSWSDDGDGDDCFSDGGDDMDGGEDSYYDDFSAANLDADAVPRYEYTVLKESEIRRNQEDDISRVAAFYSVSRSDATLLLLHFNWSVNKLNDAWVEDEQSVRRSVGLIDRLKTDRIRDRKKSKVLCGICFENHQIGKIYSASCGHQYCSDCWTGYIGSAINDGPRCLTLRCPEPSCTTAVEGMILKFAPIEDDRNKYFKYLIRSYVDDQKNTKRCPAPNCDYVVNFVPGSGGFDVNCLCSNQFCFNCYEEAHQPVDCDTVRNWIVKNSNESENVTYILAYTKPCPECRRPIEKNAGCNHMTCNSSCRHQFCWICLADWSSHRNCNGFQTEENEDDRIKKRAKVSLQRYTHYYERWANNHISMKKAIEDLNEIKEEHMEKIKNIQIKSEANKESIAEFIIEAWKQIIECRRVLRWTYAYGYYIEEEKGKKDFFEYVQGEAEKGLERLHGYAEKELKPYLELTHRSLSDRIGVAHQSHQDLL